MGYFHTLPNQFRGEVVIRPVANLTFLCVLTPTHEITAGASNGIFTISDKSDVSSMLSSKKLVRPDKDQDTYNHAIVNFIVIILITIIP